MLRRYVVPLAVACSAVSAHAQAEILRADARQQPAAPISGQLHMGTANGPDGPITVNNRYLTKNGAPWLPVMGELHFARLSADEWDAELQKMKAAGVDIVSTYVMWNYHEEKPGRYNFSGDRDIRRFLDLAKKNGLYVVLRLGPWAHAEVRYGGIPDWVVAQVPTRCNDPQYLAYVRDYWSHLAQQTRGEMYKDGGPVIGVQLENEYNLTGPGRGAEHIAALKQMARELGFDVPLYTVTGWDGTVYPKGEVLPVQGGYPDEPWAASTKMMPPNEVYSFRFDGRIKGNAGAQTPAKARGTATEDMDDTPFLGAEFAAGLPVMYRRRPVVQPQDIAAMLPVELGSGVNLYGYYMFHGGRNPQGDTQLEESDLNGGYNGLPVINYDFQAPYGQYGQPNPVLNLVRPWHEFLNAFGDRLAPMTAHRPQVEPKGRDDLTTPRWSVRSLGDSGFVFLSNHVRQYAMAAQTDVQFRVDLPSGPLTFPSQPVSIADGAAFAWPFNFDLDGVKLLWASAQPVTRIQNGKTILYVFEAQDGIAPEFAFDRDVTALSGRKSRAEGHVVVRDVAPGRGVAIRAGKVEILVLSSKDAQGLTVLDYQGQKSLIISDALVYGDGEHLRLRSENPQFSLGVWPPIATPKASLPLAVVKTTGLFQTFRAQAVAVSPQARIEKIRDAGSVPPLVIGGKAKAALQPYPETYGQAAAWKINIDHDALSGVADMTLDIRYRGDVARLFDGPNMVDDQFWYGPDWRVGLKRLGAGPFILNVLPLRADAPVYIDDAYRPAPTEDAQVADVASVKLIPTYALDLD
jgi:hypothetical protein